MRRRLVLLVAGRVARVGLVARLRPGRRRTRPRRSTTPAGGGERRRTRTVLLPPPPNVAKGQLLVQSGPEGATALAAIAGTLVEGEANPVLTLKVAAERRHRR